MLRLYLSFPLVLLVLTRSTQARQNEQTSDRHTQTTEPGLQQIRSPLMEVFARLPPNIRPEVHPQRLKRTVHSASNDDLTPKTVVHVRNYQITQPVSFHDPNDTFDGRRTKRAVEHPRDDKPESPPNQPEPQKLVSPPGGSVAMRGPVYKTYPVKEFDVVDIDDPDDPRRRRTDASTGDEDSTQRDKRTFMEEGTSGETTTPVPFWKRKKDSLPFVTGRAGSIQSGSGGGYTPAQHRSGENSRESHSLKNLEKTLQSNEISRSNQDNYYSSTNRRTYGRQYDGPPTSTPKSVYDSIDYNTKRNTDPGRNEFPARNQDDKKEATRETKPQTHEQYSNRQYNPPWMYDRPLYQPAYPYPTEILGRGVEYYHRTYDPTTGRIIYYANMPEQPRSYDYYRFLDPTNRSFYLNSRPYPSDPYYRNYVPPFDYRFLNPFARSGDYVRTGRSGSQAYSYPYQERDKFQRDARFVGGVDWSNRFKDDSRNKTYIIYDADDSRSQFSRPQLAHENNRLAYTPAPAARPQGPQGPQVPFKQFPFPPPPADFFPNRNNFGHMWGFSHRAMPGVTDSSSGSRPLNSPEVQLPLTTSNRGDLDKPNKS